MELIKQIEEYPDYYVTNTGRVYSTITKKFLKTHNTNCGYEHLTLVKNGEHKDVNVHRLVAKAFVPNPKGLKVVNHKDECKTNNNADNLEWCDTKYNTNYGKCKEIRNTKVYQITDEGEIFWGSIKEAAEALGIKYQGISRVCRGLKKHSGGYGWRYA